MAYTSNTPGASDQISQTQSLIQANFMALSSFGNGYAELSNQASTPSFSAGNDGLYTKTYANTSVNELFIHKTSFDAPDDVPFTASKMSNSPMASCVSGWSYFPSGMLMKWGTAQITANGSATINVALTSGGPNFNQVFTAYITPAQSGVTTPTFNSILSAFPAATTGNLTVISSGSTATTTAIAYMVLGV